MATAKTVQEMNRELADKLAEEARNNPQPPHAGKFIGIANGQVAVVAETLAELVERLGEVEPDPTKTFAVEVGRDYDNVEESWSFSTPHAMQWERVNAIREELAATGQTFSDCIELIREDRDR